jgi:hypothetical protein
MPSKTSKRETHSTKNAVENSQAGMRGGISSALQAWGPMGEYMTDAMQRTFCTGI